MRKHWWTLVLVAGSHMVSPWAAHGQQEVQVHMDLEERVQVVNAQLAERLGLFQERFPGFREARLMLQLPDSVYLLEIITEEQGRTLRDRLPLTATEVEEFRSDVSRRLAGRAPAATLDREGRPRLLGGSTLLGLGFYGWAVPVMFDVDDAATGTGLYMLTAGAGFVGPWMATRRRAITRGTADLALYGGTRGIVHGLLAHLAVTGGDDDEPDSTDDEFRGAVSSALVFSLAEGLGGWVWAHRNDLDLGTTRTIGMIGDFGMVEGLALAGLVDPDERVTAVLILAGGAAGTALGPTLASRRGYSAGDVTVMSVGGWVGTYAGLALADLAQPEEDRWYAAGAMVGSLGGLVVGDRLVRSYRFSEGQGRLIALGAVAGGAVGLGVAHLIVGNDSEGGNEGDNSRVYLTSSALGATAGYALTFRSLAPDAETRRTGQGSLQLDVNPLGAASVFLGSHAPGRGRVPVPVVSASYRF